MNAAGILERETDSAKKSNKKIFLRIRMTCNVFCNGSRCRIRICSVKLCRKEEGYTVTRGNMKEDGTLIVKIICREHSTWQGSVTWVEEDKTQNFRSALELLKMIDGALGTETDKEGGGQP